MLSWKQFTDYAAELQLKTEYVEQNREFFEKIDPAFFDRIFNADKFDPQEIKTAFPGEEYRRFMAADGGTLQENELYSGNA